MIAGRRPLSSHMIKPVLILIPLHVKLVPTATFLNFYNPLEGVDFYFRLAASSIMPIGTKRECVYLVGKQATLINTDDRKMCMHNISYKREPRIGITRQFRPQIIQTPQTGKKTTEKKKTKIKIFSPSAHGHQIRLYFYRTIKAASEPKHPTPRKIKLTLEKIQGLGRRHLCLTTLTKRQR